MKGHAVTLRCECSARWFLVIDRPRDRDPAVLERELGEARAMFAQLHRSPGCRPITQQPTPPPQLEGQLPLLEHAAVQR